MYSVVFISPAGRPAVLHSKNVNVGHYESTFQPFFFVPAMLIGTIGLPFYVTFTGLDPLTGCYKICKKQQPLGFIFSHSFQLIRMEFGKVSR